MNFIEQPIQGVYVIEPKRFADDRGFFTSFWERTQFERRGLVADFAQFNLAFNHRKGTLRGMHYQAAPHTEVKLVRCTRGAVYDVVIDLRPGSPTFAKHVGCELTADNYRVFYVPKGFAHGYVTLSDGAEVAYNVSAPYTPAAGRGVRWNDPAFGIDWKTEVLLVNPRDNTYPDLNPAKLEL